MHSFAYHIGKEIRSISLDSIQATPTNGFYWVGIERSEFDALITPLSAQCGIHIHEQHIKDTQNPEHPSFIDHSNDYELIIIRSCASYHMSLTFPNITLSAVSTVFFNFENMLITVFDEFDPVISRIQGVIENSIRPHLKNPGDLLYRLINACIEQLLQLRVPLTQLASEWQSLMLEHDSSFERWNDFMSFKSTIEQTLGWCEDIEELLEDWRLYTKQIEHQQFTINLNDLEDHIQRALNYNEKISKNLDTLVQLHFSVVSHRNNEVLKVLAIISAIFLPLTLITGIFGMNFEHMPVLQNHYGYYLTLFSMFIVAILFLFIFRYKKWI